MTRGERVPGACARVGWAMLAGVGSVALLLGLGSVSTAQPPGAGKTETIRGVVERFTTAPKGEVDGCILDDGTWVHWPPHLADRVAGLFVKKDRIRVTGRFETGPKGDTKFEAQTITNLRNDKSATLADGPGAVPRLDGKAEREERLRALERELRQLLEEIKRLRREQ